MASRRYFTTTLPYVNAKPHLGFALELVQADTLARVARLAGEEVFLNTGTDEHGVKIWRRARAEGQEASAYVAAASRRFQELLPALGIMPEINFIRTTAPAHISGAQEFWRRAADAGDIYKKNYRTKYCVGCELEKTDSELVDGACPLHPTQALEIVEEENYFFRFSRFQQPLLELYKNQPDFVLPSSRLNEIQAFVARGLDDFSISRLRSKMPWGVPVPGDGEQVMYVWFDALVNYLTTLGWPQPGQFEKFWVQGQPVQLAGKDNLRQQAAMWPAMLLSAKLPLPRQIVIHGFLTHAGQKMSKSSGNVIDPFELVDEYGTDAVRYFLLRHVHPFEDADFSREKFLEAYNAHLANGLGNLVSRVIKMAAPLDLPPVNLPAPAESVLRHLGRFEFGLALDFIWREIAELDGLIQETQPFKTIKTDPERAKEEIGQLLNSLALITANLGPCLPSTAKVLARVLNELSLPAPLFPRHEP